jgi:hypothetical protein
VRSCCHRRRVGGLYQPNRCAWNTEANGNLRAERAKFQQIGQSLVDEQIILVAAVIAHLLAQQAAADADRDFCK